MADQNPPPPQQDGKQQQDPGQTTTPQANPTGQAGTPPGKEQQPTVTVAPDILALVQQWTAKIGEAGKAESPKHTASPPGSPPGKTARPVSPVTHLNQKWTTPQQMGKNAAPPIMTRPFTNLWAPPGKEFLEMMPQPPPRPESPEPGGYVGAERRATTATPNAPSPGGPTETAKMAATSPATTTPSGTALIQPSASFTNIWERPTPEGYQFFEVPRYSNDPLPTPQHKTAPIPGEPGTTGKETPPPAGGPSTDTLVGLPPGAKIAWVTVPGLAPIAMLIGPNPENPNGPPTMLGRVEQPGLQPPPGTPGIPVADTPPAAPATPATPATPPPAADAAQPTGAPTPPVVTPTERKPSKLTPLFMVQDSGMIDTLAVYCMWPDCKLMFPSRGEHDDHQKLVHGKDRFSCLGCTASYDNIEDLGRHVRHIHGDRKKTGWTCAECPKSYRTHNKLHKHHYRYHFKGLYKCYHPGCAFGPVNYRDEIYLHYYKAHDTQVKRRDIRRDLVF